MAHGGNHLIVRPQIFLAVELKEEDAGRLTVYLDWQGEELTAQVQV